MRYSCPFASTNPTTEIGIALITYYFTIVSCVLLCVRGQRNREEKKKREVYKKLTQMALFVGT